MDDVFVIGTLLDRRIYTSQHGWVKPDDTRKIIAGFIFGRTEADKMLSVLRGLPCSTIRENELMIFPVSLSLASFTGSSK